METTDLSSVVLEAIDPLMSGAVTSQEAVDAVCTILSENERSGIAAQLRHSWIESQRRLEDARMMIASAAFAVL
jgi:hypothetical protein